MSQNPLFILHRCEDGAGPGPPWCGYAGEDMARILAARASAPASSCRRWSCRRQPQGRPARWSGSSRSLLRKTTGESPWLKHEQRSPRLPLCSVQFYNEIQLLVQRQVARMCGTAASSAVNVQRSSSRQKLWIWEPRCACVWLKDGVKTYWPPPSWLECDAAASTRRAAKAAEDISLKPSQYVSVFSE